MFTFSLKQEMFLKHAGHPTSDALAVMMQESSDNDKKWIRKISTNDLQLDLFDLDF